MSKRQHIFNLITYDIMTQAQINNYIVDCLGMEANELKWEDLTEGQKGECKNFNY